jgi:hypothetical protein
MLLIWHMAAFRKVFFLQEETTPREQLRRRSRITEKQRVTPVVKQNITYRESGLTIGTERSHMATRSIIFRKVFFRRKRPPLSCTPSVDTTLSQTKLVTFVSKRFDLREVSLAYLLERMLLFTKYFFSNLLHQIYRIQRVLTHICRKNIDNPRHHL